MDEKDDTDGQAQRERREIRITEKRNESVHTKRGKDNHDGFYPLQTERRANSVAKSLFSHFSKESIASWKDAYGIAPAIVFVRPSRVVRIKVGVPETFAVSPSLI